MDWLDLTGMTFTTATYSYFSLGWAFIEDLPSRSSTLGQGKSPDAQAGMKHFLLALVLVAVPLATANR